METCDRCQEHWFAMNLKDGVCHACFLRDKRGQTPFLMSAENQMDPGVLPAHLPVLTQIEEMVIARSHVQMVLYRYHGHQYHYSGHCVSFMQNMIKTVDVLPNLPSELDIVVLRPSDYVENETRYRHQFRSDFRVRKNHIITWLRFLKANHPGYQDVTISLDRIQSLPADDDVSSSITTINEIREPPEQQSPDADDSSSSASDVSSPPVSNNLPSISDNPPPILDVSSPPVSNNLPSVSDDPPPISDDSPPPNTQSMVPNLNVTATEADLIMQQLASRDLPLGIPAPSIRHTPIDEASGRDHIFTMAFPTLYPTGQADFNMPRIRKVALNDYARHLLCYRDGRFGRHPRWRFFVFNLLMRRKANTAARFYVSKASGLKDLDREELADALQADESLLPQIVR
jgi:hypothetical protein